MVADLVKHQIYYFQGKFGTHWLMPIDEVCDRTNVILASDINVLLSLDKLDKIDQYTVNGEMPFDKWGVRQCMNCCMANTYLLDCLLINIDDVRRDKYCLGTPKAVEIRRELKLKQLL